MLCITELISGLHNDFPITNLDSLHYFLGVEATFNSKGLVLTQHKYMTDLLHRTNMQLAKPVKTPMSTSEKLSAFTGHLFEDPTLYLSTTNSLQYLSFTRPDLDFAIGKVCQFMHTPWVPHWKAVKCILRYLKHTSTVGLQFSSSPTSKITAFSDADWARCLNYRRSTSGYCLSQLQPHIMALQETTDGRLFIN